jgi:hypothetical protein
MAKARLSLLVVAGLLLSSALVLTAAPEASGGKSAKIKQLSHEHPDADFSQFCGKVTGKPGKRYRVKAFGPAVVDSIKKNPRTFKMGKKGVKKVTFDISQPGTYFLSLKKPSGKLLDKKDYVVPPPPPDGAAVGPFAC